MSETFVPLSLWQRITSGLHNAFQAARHFVVDDPNESGPVTFLGKTYDQATDPEFLQDFYSKIWFTYRNGFSPLDNGATEDSGWGCMHRTGQSLLANALLSHQLGRDWRLSHAPQSMETYQKIVSLFLDDPSRPFSLHKITKLGTNHEKSVGQWFGPNTVSHVLTELVQDQAFADFGAVVACDGAIYDDQILSLFPKSVFIFLPIRLGLDKLNTVYVPGLKELFSVPQCMGIAGGRPNSSLFFMGYQGNHVVYLDPHYIQPALLTKHEYTLEDLQSFHCHHVRFTSFESLDPSMVVGFYIKDANDYLAFKAKCEKVLDAYNLKISKGKFPLFSILERTPTPKDIDFISDMEEF